MMTPSAKCRRFQETVEAGTLLLVLLVKKGMCVVIVELDAWSLHLGEVALVPRVGKNRPGFSNKVFQ